MQKHRTELSPDITVGEDRIQTIVHFWNGLRACDDSGATTWEVLDSLEKKVTECMYHDPPDMQGAESLTAKAALLIAGNRDL